MYKKIFVPVDGSDTSNTALQEAVKLAKEQGAQLRLSHVLEPLYHLDVEAYGDFRGVVQRESQKLLDDAVARARQGGAEVTGAVVDSAGRRVAATIVEEAQKAGADLIVMGTHGHRGFEHLVLGSVAEGVVRRATMPVLLIRGE
ncbi:MAG: universal stress protein [Pseudomonadota bacterium]